MLLRQTSPRTCVRTFLRSPGALPQPVVSAEVLSIDVGEEEAVATIRWTGETDAVTIRSRWRDIGGHPLLVHAEPGD